MAKICPAAHLKSTTVTTPLTTASASPSRITTAAIVGAVVFGVMFFTFLTVLFYAGWAHNRGPGPNSHQRRLQFPRLGVFRAWLDPQAQMFPISLGTSRDADDATLRSFARARPVVAQPARVLHEPLPPYEHPPPYGHGLGSTAPSTLNIHDTVAGAGATSNVDLERGPL